jgi:hypothetical protein
MGAVSKDSFFAPAITHRSISKPTLLIASATLGLFGEHTHASHNVATGGTRNQVLGVIAKQDLLLVLHTMTPVRICKSVEDEQWHKGDHRGRGNRREDKTVNRPEDPSGVACH